MEKDLETVIKENKEKLNVLKNRYRSLYQKTSFLDIINEANKNGVAQGGYYAYSIEEFEKLFDDEECLKLDVCPGELFFDRDYIFILDDKSLLVISAYYAYNYVDADRNIKLSAKKVPHMFCYGIVEEKSYIVNEEEKTEIKRRVFTLFNDFKKSEDDYYANKQIALPGLVFIEELITPISLNEILDRIYNSEMYTEGKGIDKQLKKVR